MQDGDGTNVTEVVVEFGQYDGAKFTAVEDNNDAVEKNLLWEEVVELQATPIRNNAVIVLSSVKLWIVSCMMRFDLEKIDEFEKMQVMLKRLMRWIGDG